jgi:hypothetical protein
MRVWVFVGLFSCLIQNAVAKDEGAAKAYGNHYGYLFDVQGEKNQRDVEMVMLPGSKGDAKPLSEVIFNEKLSKEFQQQYEYRFGQSQAEQVLNSVGRTDGYNYYTGRSVTVKEFSVYQQQFAEYMGRRLVEHHVDNWVKNDPDLKPVYDFKERVSNVNVQVRKGYKFKWKYNFSGPNMDLRLDNPYDVEMKVRIEMSGILSSPNEIIYSLGYSFSPRVRGTFLHRQEDGLYQLVFSRRLSRRLSTSLSGSVDTKREGPSVQQNLVLLGFSWSE